MFAVLFKIQIYNHWLSITVALSGTSFERKTLSYILGQTFMMCNTKSNMTNLLTINMYQEPIFNNFFKVQFGNNNVEQIKENSV